MTELDGAAAGMQGRHGATPRRKASGIARSVRDILIIFLIALLASFLIKTFLARSFYIPSGSMENTLLIQDRVMVNELVPNLIGVQRGDVIVFKDPGGWLPATAEPAKNPVVAALDWMLQSVGLAADDSDDHLIKRVIGLPGDTVTCCSALGQTTVNGVPLNEPYTKSPASELRPVPFSVTVPAGSVWVEGDNRDNSEDSRFHAGTPGKGFVPMSDIVGRAFVIIWPIPRWTGLDDYPTVFEGADPPQADR